VASAGRARIHERAARRRVVTGSPWLRDGCRGGAWPPRWSERSKARVPERRVRGMTRVRWGGAVPGSGGVAVVFTLQRHRFNEESELRFRLDIHTPRR